MDVSHVTADDDGGGGDWAFLHLEIRVCQEYQNTNRVYAKRIYDFSEKHIFGLGGTKHSVPILSLKKLPP